MSLKDILENSFRHFVTFVLVSFFPVTLSHENILRDNYFFKRTKNHVTMELSLSSDLIDYSSLLIYDDKIIYKNEKNNYNMNEIIFPHQSLENLLLSIYDESINNGFLNLTFNYHVNLFLLGKYDIYVTLTTDKEKKSSLLISKKGDIVYKSENTVSLKNNHLLIKNVPIKFMPYLDNLISFYTKGLDYKLIKQIENKKKVVTYDINNARGFYIKQYKTGNLSKAYFVITNNDEKYLKVFFDIFDNLCYLYFSDGINETISSFKMNKINQDTYSFIMTNLKINNKNITELLYNNSLLQDIDFTSMNVTLLYQIFKSSKSFDQLIINLKDILK